MSSRQAGSVFRHQDQGVASNGSSMRISRNVGPSERLVSVAAGAVLAGLGMGRRDLIGLAIVGIGGAMALRGATGRCPLYKSLGLNTAESENGLGRRSNNTGEVSVAASYLINKSPEHLYSFWRNFENLPQFMSHLESVQTQDGGRTHWVAKAPSLYGGTVEWDAEITAEQPSSYIAWRSLPGGDVEHRGSIRFEPALGDRGTKVRVELHYQPPGGQAGRWLAKLFREEPEQQIHDDLRNFKRLMELGELPTIEGQSRGNCLG
jgi:uncharacterized membrane protein